MTLQELGGALREAREQNGLSASEVASRLKISVRMVEGVEAGDLDVFPHPVYACGCIKAYGALMHFPSEAIQDVLAEMTPAEIPSIASSPLLEPVPRSKFADMDWGLAARMIGVVLLLALLVIGFLYRAEIHSVVSGLLFGERSGTEVLSAPQPSAEPSVEPGGAALTPPTADTPQAGSASGDSPAGSMPEASPPVQPEDGARNVPADSAGDAQHGKDGKGQMSAQVEDGTAPPPADRSSEEAAPPKKEQEQKKSVPGAAKEQHKLEFIAVRRVWISVRTGKGTARAVELRSGEKFSHEFTQPVSVRIGNAGGVRIVYDGVVQPPAGREGQVVVLTFPR